MKVLIIFSFLLGTSIVKAQIYNPVKWSCAAKKTGKGEAIIYIKGVIDEGWHVYSVNQPPGGPLKTSFTFSPSVGYKLVGEVMEPVPIAKFEDTFKIQVFYFNDSVLFKQKVRLKKREILNQVQNDVVHIKGKIDYMACTEEHCTPPLEMKFSIPITR